MRRRSRWLVTLAIVLLLLAMPVAGLTDAFGTAGRLQATLGGWSPDGAAHDTFWDSPVFDIPGLSVTAVHCHGYVRQDLQLGATGPPAQQPVLRGDGGLRLRGGAVGNLHDPSRKLGGVSDQSELRALAVLHC